MSLISVQGLSFQAGTKQLFDGLSLHLEEGDRVGLVGHNGAGKSTLLRLLTGELQPDAGRIVRQRGLSIGLVEQFLPGALEALTARDAVLDALDPDRRLVDGWRVESLLEALGFAAALWEKPLARLSGGQKNLVLFARAIVREPELLLLDEPGNHMDSQALYHLKRYLTESAVPAFLMISHDRDLLDDTTRQTLWLRDLRAYRFDVPYTRARQALEAQDEAAQRARAAEEKEIARLKASAKRLATWGRVYDNEKFTRRAKSIEQRIDRLAAEVTFVSEGSGLSLAVDAEWLQVKQVFILDHTEVCTPDGRALFSVDELTFRPGDRVALLGVNGAGKSTLIRTMLAAAAMDPGSQTDIRFNPNVRIGYFDQELDDFGSDAGIYAWVRARVRRDEDTVKRTLIHWGFPWLARDRPVRVLSGGERARLVLLTFQLNQPNLLVMDEPTNHIDLKGKEELEADLLQPGLSLLFTSHDRRFIETVATRFWWIDRGRLIEMPDAAAYFTGMGQVAAPRALADSHADQDADTVSVVARDEDRLLERLVELERLLAEDQARPERFQKPARQQVWEAELVGIRRSLGLD
ncbi:MAG: ABC-F family ATP-binding cassette domain-containing protein [Pseudomonadales bacterium]|nr:ABC-F family ATP-binding cassette domain-containing protein [Pseudomonadales bacterium]